MAEPQDKCPPELARTEQYGLPSITPSAQSTPLAPLDARIFDPATPVQEVMILADIRGKMILQDELVLDRANARQNENRQFWGKLAFSVGAVGTGVGLIATGLHLEGFVILGIGFHWLAPDFVKNMYDRILGGKENGDAE